MPYASPLPQPPRARQRWLILSLAAVQLLVVSSSFVVMSSARLITNADGLWSRSLPAALVDLHRYAATGSAHDYQEFQQSLAAPLGFSTARNLLEAGNHNSLALRRRATYSPVFGD